MLKLKECPRCKIEKPSLGEDSIIEDLMVVHYLDKNSDPMYYMTCIVCQFESPPISCDSLTTSWNEAGEAFTRKSAAIALGRAGGLKGGKARAEKLTPEQRSEIAKKAAQKRWGDR